MELFRLFRKTWWFIALFTVLVTGFAYYLSYYKMVSVYSNSSSLLVNERNPNQEQSRVNFNDLLIYEKLIGTYKDIMMSDRILSVVSARTGMSTDEIRGHLHIGSKANSQVMRITFDYPDYKRATEMANQVSEAFRDNLHTIMDINNVQILDRAELKPNPVPLSPRRKMNVFVSGLLSLIISVSLVFLWHYFDTRIRGEEDLNGLTDLPVLGSIPNYSDKTEGYLHRRR